MLVEKCICVCKTCYSPKNCSTLLKLLYRKSHMDDIPGTVGGKGGQKDTKMVVKKL